MKRKVRRFRRQYAMLTASQRSACDRRAHVLATRLHQPDEQGAIIGATW